MTAAPLFAPILPPGTSPARPTQGEGASDVAGLFALLLAGAPVQAHAAQGAAPSTGPASDAAPARAGVSARAPAPPPLTTQPSPPLTAGTVAPGRPDTAPAAPALSPLPVPAQAGSGQDSPLPQAGPQSPDAPLSVAAATHGPERTGPPPALHPTLADPSSGRAQPPGATAHPLPATSALPPGSMVGPFGTPPTAGPLALPPELTSITAAADATWPPVPSGGMLQINAPRAAAQAPFAEPRAPGVASAGDRSTGAPGPAVRRPHAPPVAPTFASSGPAADQAASDDQFWLEPGIEGSDRAVVRFEHAATEPARAPAPGRAAFPAPMLQIGVHVAKAIPARIDRLFVQLEPASLGRVEVRLEFHRDNQVSAVIAAERPDTLDALQRDARVLERSLHQAGLRLDSDGLTFSLKREQAHDHAREEHGFAPAAGDFADQPLLAASRAEPPPLEWFRGLRALDIRV